MAEPGGIAESDEVHAHVAGEQHSSLTLQQRDLSCAMTKCMHNFEAACDGQHFPVSQRLIDSHRRRSLIVVVEESLHMTSSILRAVGGREHVSRLGLESGAASTSSRRASEGGPSALGQLQPSALRPISVLAPS